MVDTLGTLPDPCVGATLTYIPAWKHNGPSLLLFGGVQADREPTSASHVFDIECERWSEVQAHGDPPSPRDCPSAVCYMGRSGQERKVVIFGGMNGEWRNAPDFGRLNDVVVLDLGQLVSVAVLLLHANELSDQYLERGRGPSSKEQLPSVDQRTRLALSVPPCLYLGDLECDLMRG